MKNYYYIPIALAHGEFHFYWVNNYEGRIKLKARNIKQAQKKAEEKYKWDKEWNLRFFVSGVLQPNDKEKEKLKTNYPNKLILISMEKPLIFTKENTIEWIEDRTSKVSFSFYE